MKPHTPTWIVLVDGSRGRIVVQDAPGAPLTRPFGDGFTSTRALGDSGEGRLNGFGGDSPARISFEPRVPERAEPAFSAQVASFLDRSVGERRVGRVIIVAPSHALSELRKALSPRAYARVQTEIARDWLDLTDVDIGARLGDVLLGPTARPLAG